MVLNIITIIALLIGNRPPIFTACGPEQIVYHIEVHENRSARWTLTRWNDAEGFHQITKIEDKTGQLLPPNYHIRMETVQKNKYVELEPPTIKEPNLSNIQDYVEQFIKPYR